MKEFSQKYFDILHGKLAGLNLTAIHDSEEFFNKQILDSVLPIEECELFRHYVKNFKLLVDIGFGGGFPLLPLSYYFRNQPIQLIGFEAKRKKVEAVKEIIEELDLRQMTSVHHQRLENIFFDRQCVLTFKAVGKCRDYLNLIQTNQEIIVVFYKGPNFYQLEGDDCKKEIKGWKLIKEFFISPPQTEGRWIIIFQSSPVPHGTKSNKNKLLVNLSQFL